MLQSPSHSLGIGQQRESKTLETSFWLELCPVVSSTHIIMVHILPVIRPQGSVSCDPEWWG